MPTAVAFASRRKRTSRITKHTPRSQRRLAKKRAEKGSTRNTTPGNPTDAPACPETVTEDSLPEYMREDFVDEPLHGLDAEAGASARCAGCSMDGDRRSLLADIAGLSRSGTGGVRESEVPYFLKLDQTPIKHRSYGGGAQQSIAALHLRHLEGHGGDGCS